MAEYPISSIAKWSDGQKLTSARVFLRCRHYKPAPIAAHNSTIDQCIAAAWGFPLLFFASRCCGYIFVSCSSALISSLRSLLNRFSNVWSSDEIIQWVWSFRCDYKSLRSFWAPFPLSCIVSSANFVYVMTCFKPTLRSSDLVDLSSFFSLFSLFNIKYSCFKWVPYDRDSLVSYGHYARLYRYGH